MGAGTGDLAADLARVLTPANLPVNGAAEVWINSGLDYGKHAVINDGVAGYSPASDAVVKLLDPGPLSVLYNTDFIV